MSKELSASAKTLSESRECFIEVYIDNRCLIVIVFNCFSLSLPWRAKSSTPSASTSPSWTTARWCSPARTTGSTSTVTFSCPRCQRHKTVFFFFVAEAPGPVLQNFFTVVIHEFSVRVGVFVPGRTLQPSLMFVGMAKRIP